MLLRILAKVVLTVIQYCGVIPENKNKQTNKKRIYRTGTRKELSK